MPRAPRPDNIASLPGTASNRSSGEIDELPATPLNAGPTAADRAADAVENIRRRFKERADHGERLRQLEQSVADMRRQSMSQGSDAQTLVELATVLKKLENRLAKVEKVCQSLEQVATFQQQELDRLAESLGTLADEDE